MLQMLSVDEAAAQLGVHPVTIRREITRGKLRSTRVGRLVKVEQGDLIAYVRRSQPEPPANEPATPGMLRAFHAKCADLDKRRELERGTTKRAKLAELGITSSTELDSRQMSALLDRLENEIDAAA